METITGSIHDFTDLLRTAAARRLSWIGASEALDAVMEAGKRMRPFPEAGEAIATLRASGIGTGVLTNSSAETARSLLSHAGLELDPVIGADQVNAFKPDRHIYQRAVEATSNEASEVVLITAHWWDALGAKRAGLQAAWISRKEGIRLDVEPPPEYEARDLAEVARRIASA